MTLRNRATGAPPPGTVLSLRQFGLTSGLMLGSQLLRRIEQARAENLRSPVPQLEIAYYRAFSFLTYLDRFITGVDQRTTIGAAYRAGCAEALREHRIAEFDEVILSNRISIYRRESKRGDFHRLGTLLATFMNDGAEYRRDPIDDMLPMLEFQNRVLAETETFFSLFQFQHDSVVVR